MRFWPFKRRETRSQSYTTMLMDARADMLKRGDVSELSATVQGCLSLWEQGLSLADTNNPMLTPSMLALTARSLGLRGESVWVIDDDRLIPVDQFDITTRGSVPRAYRVTIPDVGGGTSTTVLADEVLHFRIGCNPSSPWRGTPPLKRAAVTAGILHAVEDTLSEVFSNAPIGSQIVAMPETAPGDNDKLAASFRGKRGRVLLRESTNVTAAGGPAPAMDWKPSDLTPSLRDSMLVETLREAKGEILNAYGVLPSLVNNQTTGPLVREAQRHLAQWTLTPIATMMAAECTSKLDDTTIDVSAPLHAFDVGGRARALTGVIAALGMAKEAGLTPEQVAAAMRFADVPQE